MKKSRQQYVESFKKLDYQAKYDKVQNLLLEYKYDWNVFDDLYKNFSTVKNIEEWLLVEIYETILMIFEDVAGKKQKKAQEKLDKIKEKMDEYKKIEEKEKEDADEILNQLDFV